MDQYNKSTNPEQQYSAQDIVQLEYPECVRRRPGMYIGNTNTVG